MSHLHLADRVTAIRESPSAVAADRVRQLRAQGRDILGLTVGEPDFDTPEQANEAAIAAIRSGQTKYTSANGTPELRAAIIAHASQWYEAPFDTPNVCVGVGGKQVIFLALMATVQRGDEVLIPAPYWVSYPDMVALNDGTPVIVDTTEEDGFKLTPAGLDEAITPATRWLILNSPGNPSGAVYTAAELTALAEVLARHPHVWVLCDDIYNEISYGDEPVASLYTVAPQLRERVFVVNGVSKAYAMTGWRIGYGLGPVPLVAAINKLVSQISSCASSISQAAAAAALSGDQRGISTAVEAYRARRDLVVAAVNDVPGLSCAMPMGAFYAYVNCAPLIGLVTPQGTTLTSDTEVAEYLLEAAEVAVVAGAAYGLSPFFRVSFATDTHTLTRAMAQVKEAVSLLV